ncbi:MAG: TauD/TfdA family dioxygenase [bacterium]|nr:TauD/TfdA family dioxygenase [bacterium]
MVGMGNIRPLTGHIGAEISGIDLRCLDDGTVAALREAWLEHKVLFFPRQGLSPDELVHAASRFGDIEPLHPGLERHPDNPDVMVTATRDGEGDAIFNATWHSDVTFDETPPAASMLQAETLPSVGGDTLFMSMYAAWDALSERFKRAVDGLQAFHDGVPTFTPYLLESGAADGPERLQTLKRDYPGSVHPVVVRHPESGRRALYVNRGFTRRILGLPDIEGRGLLNLLLEHVEQSSFQVRWTWSEGDVAFWDNRCTMHYAARDYGPEERVMYRVTLKGSRPLAA